VKFSNHFNGGTLLPQGLAATFCPPRKHAKYPKYPRGLANRLQRLATFGDETGRQHKPGKIRGICSHSVSVHRFSGGGTVASAAWILGRLGAHCTSLGRPLMRVSSAGSGELRAGSDKRGGGPAMSGGGRLYCTGQARASTGDAHLHAPTAENNLWRDARFRRARTACLLSKITRCSHSTAISADQWPDHVRLCDIEPLFTCKACGRRRGDVRPDLRWNKPLVPAWAMVEVFRPPLMTVR
jgi:hypothetical protein